VLEYSNRNKIKMAKGISSKIILTKIGIKKSAQGGF
jgi:hypothetical protein